MTVIIRKILNNNVVISQDDRGKEIIIMGRGIAFNKKIGDHVSESVVDKVFILEDKENRNKLEELLSDIPVEYMSISDEIIAHAKIELGKRINEGIYITLSDHVYTAIIRAREGILVKNALLWDIKRFYQDEFIIGKWAIDHISRKLNVILPEDEAGFIALHFVNAEMDEDLSTIYQLTEIMQEIMNIIKYFFQVKFNEESVYYYRFITHLKFFAQRLLSKEVFAGTDDGLLLLIKTKYHNSYACVEKIAQYLRKTYFYNVTDEEKLYLTIHIERIISKQ